MNTTATHTGVSKWLPLVFAAGLLISFFLPWVSWEGIPISGYYMPAGKFFRIAETNFGLGNPFPQFNFTFLVFWLVPAVLVFCFIQASRKKPIALPGLLAAALALSLATVFYLFTSVLVDLGVGSSAFKSLQPSIYLSVISATGLILTVLPRKAGLKKIGWLLAGPLFALIGFMLVQGYIKNEKFSDTSGAKADYTVNAPDLIHEFTANDSSANNKYREKILIVNGIAAKVETSADSTTNIQFADSTGSYAIFSFDKEQLEQVKDIKAGDTVSVKGSCSGSIYSSILGTTSISFKRSTLNKKNQ
ncbi:MAG: hypothetical protein ABIR30_14040 [Chitinophagaceae bacterium]